MVQSNFEIAFDHFQFLIGDKASGPLVDTSTLWDNSQLIGIVPDIAEIVGISTVRYGGKLNISIQVADDTEIDCESWSQLGEFEINVPSGELIVWGPETDNLDHSPTIGVSPGRYRAIAYSRGTDDVTDEMEIEGPDEYCVVMCKVEVNSRT